MKTKNILYSILSALCLLGASCSPDEFDGANPNGIPTMENVDFQISVDQETNQMVAHYTPAPGTYPVWILDGAAYSTLNEVGYKNDEAGTHTIELRLGNRNGFSVTGIKKEYTFNETKIDYTADFRRITGKEWRIDNKEAAHMGCGEGGTDGSNWWAAAADEKKAFGVYDDRITFTADTRKGGTYTYNAGADGLTYVNKETQWANGAKDDLDVELGNQTSIWDFEELDWTDKEGKVSKQRYIRLGEKTLFPYMSSNEQYENPLFRVEQLTASKMVLVYEKKDHSIAWRFIFTSKEGEKEFAGFDANSDYNMWKGITPSMEFWYAPGWTQIDDPGFVDAGNDYTIELPQATTDQWQAQVKFHTDLTTSATSNYDFSAIFNSDKDLNGATVKLVLDGDDGVFYFTDRIDLKAGEDYIFWKSNMPGIDMSKVMLVLDFGGCQENTVVNVSNIVLKDHANDDGTVLPEVDPVIPDEPVMDWDYDCSANLWKNVDNGTLFDAFGYWFADNSWSALPTQPEATHQDDLYEITLPEGMGGSQWQGQFHIDTKLTASAEKTYNFCLVMEADQDCPGVTFKLTDEGDTNYFIEERNDLKADEAFILKREGVTLKENKDANAIRLFFDFGGSPAGTHVKISKIYFEEVLSLNYNDADNLWKAVDDGSAFDSFGYWFADNSWTALPTQPVAYHEDNFYEITIPEGMGGSQWQGQFHIDTKLKASGDKQYHFQLMMEADQDCPGVTIKLTDGGDTNFFCEGRHDIAGDEPYIYTLKNATLKEGKDADVLRLFFDFGGSPADTHVRISKIILKEVK